MPTLARALFKNLRNPACPDRQSTFADGERRSALQSHRRNQLHIEVDVVAGHDHFHTIRQHDCAGHIHRADVELWTITAEERLVATAFIATQNVYFAFEFAVRRDRTNLRYHHSALNFLALDTAQQDAGIIARLRLIKFLIEHFDAGDGCLHDIVAQANDIDLGSLEQGDARNASGDYDP